MFVSVHEVCERILKQPLPVIFFDTCSILDVVNSLHDKSMRVDYGKNVRRLIRMHDEKRVWFVTCQTVDSEWKDNIENVVFTAKKAIQYTDRNVNCMIDFVGLSASTSISNEVNLSSLNIEGRAQELSKDLLTACLKLKCNEEHERKAYQRVRRFIAPAKRGKSEPKDCEIIEIFFDLVIKLRNSDFSHQVAFMTSNKNDFGSPGKLLAPLDVEFNAVGAQLIATPDHLLSVLSAP